MLVVVIIVGIVVAIAIFLLVNRAKGNRAADSDEQLTIQQRIKNYKAEQARKEEERLAREEAEKEKMRLLKENADRIYQDFLEKNPYIALSDWETLKKQILEACPYYQLNDSVVPSHNREFREQQKIEYKEYFDTLLTYPLDEQQREAIVTLGENVLVIAAAGSGKTSTIVAKAHYLVNKLNVDPRNILVVTYTRKAAEELQTRVGVAGVECTTFHKHAIDTIARIKGEKPIICENTILNTIFDALIKKNSAFESSFFLYQTVQKTLLQYDYEYRSYKDYLSALLEYGKMSPYRDMDGKLCYVKSRQEMEIMVILTELGLKVRYEERYPYDTSDTKYRQYLPDFTIHYELNGTDYKVYLEHFAIDKNGRVPIWFGEGKLGGWAKADQDYNEGMQWKQALHNIHGTKLIYTTSADFYDGITSVRKRIVDMLTELGVPMKPLTMEQKAAKLAIPMKRSMESTIKLVSGFIALLKANSKNVQRLIESIPTDDIHRERNTFLLKYLVQPVYDLYCSMLQSKKECDFTDCLMQASALLEEKQIYNYDYILVDEFQDMSMDKYRYLSALRRKSPRTRIFCVGDDWQSIYRFSGSDMSLFSEFEKYNGPSEELKIEATHRFGEPLLTRSSSFIQKNPYQKVKTLKGDKDHVTYLAFAGYDDEKAERSIIEKQIAKLPEKARIYIVSRYRFDIGKVFPEIADQVKDENDRAIKLNIANREIIAYTAHSCKGLEADYVFILNCNSGYDDYGFPSQVADDPILDYVLSDSDHFDHAEERRVFYVAITRAKRASYVLFDKQYPSLFVTEMGGVPKQSTDKKMLCPRCGSGSVMFVKDGYAKNNHFYTVMRCTNKACDYQHETIFFNPKTDHYKLYKFDDFLEEYYVSDEDLSQMKETTSPDFVDLVLIIPRQSMPTPITLTLDPRYDQYKLLKFYQYHRTKGDLGVCVYKKGVYERMILTVKSDY